MYIYYLLLLLGIYIKNECNLQLIILHLRLLGIKYLSKHIIMQHYQLITNFISRTFWKFWVNVYIVCFFIVLYFFLTEFLKITEFFMNSSNRSPGLGTNDDSCDRHSSHVPTSDYFLWKLVWN